MALQLGIEKIQRADQNPLFDELISRKKLKNDAELGRVLEISPTLISKVRHGRIRVSADVVLRIHTIFEIPLPELRRLMGCP